MMIQKIKNNVEYTLAVVLFFLTFFVYFSTMAPTVSFWDTGEFIATSYILGVPHPPGNPLFLLIGKLFSLFPISSDIAFRINIFSPIISAATISLLFLICNQFIERLNNYTTDNSILKFGSSFIASLTFAFTHSHWFNAVEAEVYALSGFMTALVVYLTMLWSKNRQKSYHIIYLIMIVYLMGLAIGIHLLNLLTIPFIALIIYFSINKFSMKTFFITTLLAFFVFLLIQNGIIKGLPQLVLQMGFYALFILICGLVYGAYISIKNEKTLLAIISTSVLLIIIGYSTYFTIFIRSGQNPVIDENNPETIEEAISYLNRDQYGNISFFPRKFDNLPSKIAVVGKPEYKNLEFSNKQNYDYATYKLSEQMTYLWSYQINKMYISYFLWQLIMTGIAIEFYLKQDNPQPRERDYSYVGSFMTFSIWIAIGIFGFIRKINDTFLEKSFKLPASYFMITMFLAFIPIRMLLANYHEHDRTGNYIAWDMAYNMLQTCKPNAILFTNGDNDTFPLWYLQEVEGIRKDISVTNLSLLNTPWYVKQLRDQNQDNSFINMSENEINNLDFKAWSPTIISIPAPKDSLNNSGKIEWKLNPTYFDVALRIQDLMVLRIIKDNNWNRPVYFAVTVSPTSMLNLEEYLTMEGLAYRLSNNTSQIIDVDAMTNNLLSIIGDESWFIDYNKNYNNNTNLSISKTYQPGYIYRNLANDNIYVDPQLGRLIQNYRTGFTRLAISHYLNKNFGKAEKVLLDMEKKMPTDIIEIPSKELQYQIGQLYGGLGNKVKLRYHLNQLIERNDLAINDYLLYGKTFIQTLEDYNEAKTIFKTIYDNFTNIEKALEVQGFKSTKITSLEWKEWQESLPELVFLLYLCYKELEEYDNAILLMEDWLVRSPTDLEATKLLDEIKKLQNS